MPCFSVYSERTVIYFLLRLLGLSGIVISNYPDSKSGLICFKVKFLKSLKPQNTASSFLDFGVVQKAKICLDIVDSSISWWITWWVLFLFRKELSYFLSFSMPNSSTSKIKVENGLI